MSASLPLAVLSLPAMFLAGLASSPHCALMCGALQAGHGKGVDVGRSLGRLLAYGGLGAVAASAGHRVLGAAGLLREGHALRVALLLLSLLLLVRFMRSALTAARCCASGVADSRRGLLSRVNLGFSAALVPCGLVYAAAGHALFAASTAQGALLMLAFGLGTTPGVQAGGWIWSRMVRSTTSPSRGAAGMSLIAVAAMLAAGLPLGVAWCLS